MSQSMTPSAVINRPFSRDLPLGTQKSPSVHAESARLDLLASAAPSGDGKLEQQARNLIGTTFFAQMLKQMRDSPFKSDLFSGGRGGQAFNEMFDSHLAQRMAQHSGNKLTRAIVKRYQKADAKKAYESQKNDSFSTRTATEAQHVPHDRRA